MNESNCTDYRENFQNADVIECYNSITSSIIEYDLFSIGNEINTLGMNKLTELTNSYFINFNFENDIQFCKICNQIHSNTKRQKQNLIQDNFSLIERIKNATVFKKESSASVEENNEFTSNLNKIKLKLDFLEELIDKFQLFSKNYEAIIADNLKKIRNQIANMIDIKLIEELNDNFGKLIKELDNFEQKCLKSIDTDSYNWIDFKKFISQHQVDSKTISFYLEYKNQKTQVSNENIIKEIDHFKIQLNEIKTQFNSYIYADKSLSFLQNPNSHFEINLNCLLNYTEFSKAFNMNNQELDDYSHLKSIISQQPNPKSVFLLNSLDASEVIQVKKDAELVTVHYLDASEQILICKRFAVKTNQSNNINCELHTYDLNGELTKSIKIKNCLVRCIHTSSKHVLLTVEYDHDSFSINKLANFKEFNLSIYDSNLDMKKTIKIESNNTNSLFHPIACFISEDKCYVMKSELPYMCVFDLELNLLSRFGQDIGPQFCWYLTPQNLNKIHIKNNNLFLHKINSDFTSTVVIADLKSTGFGFKKFNLKFNFSDFYVLSSTNEILFVNEKDLVIYDYSTERVNFRISLKGLESENEEDDLITSFCLTNNGFLVASYKNKTSIGIY